MLRYTMLCDGALSEPAWRQLLAHDPSAPAVHPLYRPWRADAGAADEIVLGRAAQSLDGFIATTTGASRWISGREDIVHTHRLRALCDAVIVGAGTVRADDPLLTTRACAGPSPVRVVIDAHRRLDPAHRVFTPGPPTLLLTAGEGGGDRHGAAEVVGLAADADGQLPPTGIVAALRARGLRRLLLEGGGRTVASFLLAGVLDRLHVTVAPLLLGDGIRAFPLPGCAEPAHGLRLDWTAYALGADMLLDIPLPRAAAAR